MASPEVPTDATPPFAGLTKSMEGLDLVGELTHLSDQQVEDVLREIEQDDLLPALANPLAERIPSLPLATQAVDPGRLTLEASLTVRGQDEGVPYVLTDRKIDVEVLLLTDANELAAQSPMQLDVEIVYEDGLPVDELANANHKPLLQLLGTQPLWAVSGRCRFEVKLHVLSSMRNNKLFRLRIFPADAAMRRDWPALVCQTDPAVKTLSKDPRKKKIGTDAASRAARRAEVEAEVRRRQQAAAGGAAGSPAAADASVAGIGDGPGGTADDEEKEELRAMLREQEERIRQLTEDNKRMVDELQAARQREQTQ